MAEKAVNGVDPSTGEGAAKAGAKAAEASRRIQVRRSGVHGKGVFALQDIAEGDSIVEYVAR